MGKVWSDLNCGTAGGSKPAATRRRDPGRYGHIQPATVSLLTRNVVSMYLSVCGKTTMIV